MRPMISGSEKTNRQAEAMLKRLCADGSEAATPDNQAIGDLMVAGGLVEMLDERFVATVKGRREANARLHHHA